MAVRDDEITVLLAMPALDDARSLVTALESRKVRVLMVCGTSSEVFHQYEALSPDGVILPESLMGTPAEHILLRLSGTSRVPVAIVLAYQSPIQVASRIQAVAAGWAEVAFAGARPVEEVAEEVSSLLEQLWRVAQERQQSSLQRLATPGPAAVVPGARQRRRIHLFAGVKAGAGATTLVASLAGVAVERGLRVAVIEADLSTGGQLGVIYRVNDDETEKRNLCRLRLEFGAHAGPPVELADRVQAELIPIHPLGPRRPAVELLALPPYLDQLADTPPEWPIWAAQALLDSGRYDAVLVDAGAGLADPRVRAMASQVGDVTLVSTPYPSDLTLLPRVEAILGLVSPRGHVQLVVSRSNALYTSPAPMVARMTKLRLAGFIPETPDVAEDLFRGHLTAIVRPDQPYAIAVRQLAQKFGLGVDDLPVQQPTGGFIRRLLRR